MGRLAATVPAVQELMRQLVNDHGELLGGAEAWPKCDLGAGRTYARQCQDNDNSKFRGQVRLEEALGRATVIDSCLV